MSYCVHELAATDWHRLGEIEELKGQPLPTPLTARAIVAEYAGEIVGVWFAQTQVHIEPVWIKCAHRGGVLPIRMFKQLNQLLDSCSVTSAFCLADTPTVQGYLARLGLVELPHTLFHLSRGATWDSSPLP
jgi:hypothetical protein